LAIVSRRVSPDWAFCCGLLACSAPLLDRTASASFSKSDVVAVQQLLEQQRLPWPIPDAALYQHEEMALLEGAHPLVQLINVAVRLVTLSLEQQSPVLPDWFVDDWGLNDALVFELLEQVLLEVRLEASKLDLPDFSELESSTAPASSSRVFSQSYAALSHHVTTYLQLQFPGLDEAETAADMLALLEKQFGLARSVLWQSVSAPGALKVSLPVHDADALAGMTVNVEHGIGWLAEVYRSRESQVILRQDLLSVQDRQLATYLNAEALCFIPLPEAVWVVVAEPSVLFGLQATVRRTDVLAPLVQILSCPQDDAGAVYDQPLRELYHEVSNPLTVISNYLAMLKLKLAEQAEAADVSRIEEELRRAITLLGQLKHPQSLVTEEPVLELVSSSMLDLDKLVLETSALMTDGMLENKKISTTLNLSRTHTLVRADAPRIKQVLVNLLKNAAESLPTGATVTISTQYGVMVGADRYFAITVADNGPGLPDSVKQRIYQSNPSNTADKHRGLGLSIVKRLMDEMRGIITCQSDETGTHYQLYLPE
jgi:signal transduction histidine kinase